MALAIKRIKRASSAMRMNAASVPQEACGIFATARGLMVNAEELPVRNPGG
jgi:hypothetical protein